jgi:predicted RecB family nuclease
VVYAKWNILRAMLHCSYKAWLLTKEPEALILSHEDPRHIGNQAELTLDVTSIAPDDKLALTAWAHDQTGQNIETGKILHGKQVTTFRISRYNRQGHKLLTGLNELLSNPDTPAFYRNRHCPDCQFYRSCYEKLKERNCISLLGGISPKILAKYHKKGLFSITQLAYTFRPRRRRGIPQPSGSYPWELKALAIREQKTYVLHSPELLEALVSIFIDFEGLPDENRVYLLGGIIVQSGKADVKFSYWANGIEEEKKVFKRLSNILKKYPEAPVYHYGSYETKAMKTAFQKWPELGNPGIEKRMINLLSYFRTHIYPPTYTNGLKEIANFLGFQWSD